LQRKDGILLIYYRLKQIVNDGMTSSTHNSIQQFNEFGKVKDEYTESLRLPNKIIPRL